MDKGIIIHSGEVWLTKDWLLNNHIKITTIEKWVERKSCNSIRFNNQLIFSYDSIPAQSKKKLPTKAELKVLSKSVGTISFYTTLYRAVENNYARHLQKIKKAVKGNEKFVVEFSKKAALLEAALKIDTAKKSHLIDLTDAFQKLFPGWVGSKRSLCNVLNKARKSGIISGAIDERKLGSDNAKRYGDEIKHVASIFYSGGKAYSATDIREFLDYECKENNWLLPSIRTIRNWCKEFSKNIELYSSRYGSAKTFNNVEPYISTIPALYANDQWQADGVDIPFHANGFIKYTLFYVLDVHSKKIIGYWIGLSENTDVILKALNDAVSLTNCLPFEIKMDNHSYHRTNEGQNFKAQTELLGVKWTVSHNPRHKSIIERTNKTLNERYFKRCKGYIGEGVKTKNKDGETAPELLDKYRKSGYWLTADEIKATAISVVDEYNNTVSKNGKTPAELYEESQKPNQIPVELETRIKLFTKRLERKVTRGQINVERSGVKYEYQLPATLFSKYNNETVVLHYEDFDTVYLFDNKTSQFITSLQQKTKVHGALANQTEKDIQLYNNHKGRLNGIKTKAKKKIEQAAIATNADPHILETINPITTPKDVLKQVEQNYHLKQRAEEMGIDFLRAEKSLPVDEFPLKSIVTKTKENKSPFSSKKYQLAVRSKNEFDEE